MRAAVGLAAIALAANCGLARAEGAPVYGLAITNGNRPIIAFRSNLPEGTFLMVNLKKPWAPDGAARLKAGLPACVPDCMPPQPSEGWQTTLKDGTFRNGPFSFGGRALPPGDYPLEVQALVNQSGYHMVTVLPSVLQIIQR